MAKSKEIIVVDKPKKRIPVPQKPSKVIDDGKLYKRSREKRKILKKLNKND
jgi:hypothetical protein